VSDAPLGSGSRQLPEEAQAPCWAAGSAGAVSENRPMGSVCALESSRSISGSVQLFAVLESKDP